MDEFRLLLTDIMRLRGPKIRVEFPIRQVGRLNYVPCGLSIAL